MKRMICLVAMLGLAAVGCGNNECEDAVEKIEECDVDLGDEEIDDDEASECSEDDECFAKCINGASCSEIKGFFENLEMNDFTSCAIDCSS